MKASGFLFSKDGHYIYRKEDAFTRGLPDESKVVGNLAGVHRWLRDMMTNPWGAGGTAGGGGHGGVGGGGRAHTLAKRARGEGVVTQTVPMLKPLSAAAERRRMGKLSKKIGALSYVRDEPLEDAKQEVRVRLLSICVRGRRRKTQNPWVPLWPSALLHSAHADGGRVWGAVSLHRWSGAAVCFRRRRRRRRRTAHVRRSCSTVRWRRCGGCSRCT